MAVRTTRLILTRCGPLLLLLMSLLTVPISAQAARDVTLTLVTQDSGSIEQRAAITFEAAHPGVKIKIVQESDYVDKIVAMILGGHPPDIIYDAARMQGALMSKEILQNLDPFIRADPSFNLSDFYPSIMAAFTSGGHIYAIPRGNQPDVLYYHTTMFANAGMAAPSRAWTWSDQFLIAARKLTTDGNGNGQPDIWGFYGYPDFWWPIVWDYGGSFLDSTQSRFVLNQRPGTSALEFANNLIRDSVSPEFGWGATSAFANDKAAMVQSNGTLSASLRSAGLDQGWDIAELPSGPAGRFTLVDGAGYAIPIGAAHPELSWEFISYLTSVQGLERILENGKPGTIGLTPTRRSVALGKDFMGVPPPPVHRAALLSALAYAKVPYVGGAKWPQISETLDNALAPVWKGSSSVKQALDGVAASINAILSKSD